MSVFCVLLDMRTFIAIEIPAEIKKGMAEAQGRLKVSGVEAGWTRPEGIHLTLKFLGDVVEQRIPEIMNALALAVKGMDRFRIEIAGVGAFPNPKNARDAMKDIRLSSFDVEAVSLMKSELQRSGAVYTEIGRVELKGKLP